MTQKERLSKLLHDGMVKASNTPENISFNLADYLIKNGVIVPPCKVGEKFYLVYEFGTIEERECCGFSFFNGEIEIIDEVDSRYRDNENEYYKLFFSHEAAVAASKKTERGGKPW